MLSKEENNRLLILYDCLLQLYALREQANRTEDWRRQAVLNYQIETLESEWQLLRQKRKGSFH